jgi:hypothetical protein
MKDDEHSMQRRVEFGVSTSAFSNRKAELRGFVMELHDVFPFLSFVGDKG